MRVAQAAVQTHILIRACALRHLNKTAGTGIQFRHAVEKEGDITSSPMPRRRFTHLSLGF